MFHIFGSEKSKTESSPVLSGALYYPSYALAPLRIFRLSFLLLALFMLFFSGILTTAEGLGNHEESASGGKTEHLLSTRVRQNQGSGVSSEPEAEN